MAGRLPSGHIVHNISDEEKEEQVRDFEGYRRFYESNQSLIRCYPWGWMLPSMHLRYCEKYYDLKFNPEDVLIVTYPKCGTTWTQEIVWTMLHNQNFDHPLAALPVIAKSPFLELDSLLLPETLNKDNPFYEAFQGLCPGKNIEDGIMWQLSEVVPSPRVIKTHLPLSFFKKDLINSCKIVYVVRNPKDVLMSYLHHSRLLPDHGYVGSFNHFFDYFISDNLIFSPFWPHVKEAWALRDHPNMHFIFYEDLKMNTKEEYTKLSQFLNAGLTPEKIDEIIEYTSFSAMKKREEPGMANAQNMFNKEVYMKEGGFFRKGQAGSWKNSLTPMQDAKLDLWIRKNTIGTGLKFSYGDKKKH